MKNLVGSVIRSPKLRSPTRWIPWILIPICLLLVFSYRYQSSASRAPFAESAAHPAAHLRPIVKPIPTSEPLPSGIVEEQEEVQTETSSASSSEPTSSKDDEHKPPVPWHPFIQPIPTAVSVPHATSDPTGISVSSDVTRTNTDPPNAESTSGELENTEFVKTEPEKTEPEKIEPEKIEPEEIEPEKTKPEYMESENKTILVDPPPKSPVSSPIGPFIFTGEEIERLPACSKISAEILVQLQDEKGLSAHTFFQGNPVTADETLPALAKICIIVAVEQKIPPQQFYPEAPVPGKWPDTIHLFLSSSSVRFSIPPLRSLPSQPNAHKLFSPKSILYYSELELKDEGLYHVEAEQELSNWMWAQHGWKEATARILNVNRKALDHIHGMSALEKFGASKQLRKEHRATLEVPEERKFPPDIKVSAAVNNTTLPLCHSLPDFEVNNGRWYHQKAFPNLRPETADEFGYSFDLDNCHLDYFNDRDTVDCLADKVIHVFGDSNARRLSRAILSGGRWCHNISHKCQGDDWGAPVQKIILNGKGNVVTKYESKAHKRKFEVGDQTPFKFGKNSKMWFSFLTSLAYEPKHWLSLFYDNRDYKLPPKPRTKAQKEQRKKTGPLSFRLSYVAAGAQARSPVDAENADLVIISMSSWDDAFDVTYSAYETTLPAYRDTIMEAYPDPETKLVLRLNQGYCCRPKMKPDIRRFSGTRLHHFGDLARKAFKVRGGRAMAGRMGVLDVSALTGRPEVVAAYPEGQRRTNHRRAAEVRTEAQILWNTVCSRDASGKAIWKPRQDNG